MIARTRLAWYRSCRYAISNQVRYESEQTWPAVSLLHQSPPMAKNIPHVAARRPWYAFQSAYHRLTSLPASCVLAQRDVRFVIIALSRDTPPDPLLCKTRSLDSTTRATTDSKPSSTPKTPIQDPRRRLVQCTSRSAMCRCHGKGAASRGEAVEMHAIVTFSSP